MSILIDKDLRGNFGPARDQDPRPTCMAFAASDAHAGVRSGWQPLSVEWAYFYGLQQDGGAPHDGVTMSGMLAALSLNGQPEKAAWPYIANRFTNFATWVPPKGALVFRRASTRRTATVESMIEQLNADEPVLFTMSISPAFFRPSTDGVIASPEPLQPNRVHAVVAVGHGHHDTQRFILVRNSGAKRGDLMGMLGSRRIISNLDCCVPLLWPGNCEMYLPIDPQPTNAQGWLAAASTLQGGGGEAYNVVIDIADPVAESAKDAAIIREVDTFLRGHHVNSLSGVANTIFPQSTLDRHGPNEFYSVYRERLLPRMKKATHDWGRYFDRLTGWKKIQGREVIVINPLDDLVRLMRNQVQSNRSYRNIYEITIYDPTRDAGKVANRQCLSFLSFKLTDENKLMLTVLYRNHAYIARGLGNFIGLGRLQKFVADQSGVTMGSLTCISTHAEIDHARNNRDGTVEGWTRTEANDLINSCRALNR